MVRVAPRAAHLGAVAVPAVSVAAAAPPEALTGTVRHRPPELAMTVDEATATLARHGYIRGEHTTEGMKDTKRAEIKAACRVLHEAEIAAVEAAAKKP
jgi:hypothetical protein